MKPVFKTSDRRIDNTGTRLVTKELQALIEETASAGGVLLLEKGTYLTAALFLKSHMEFRFEEGAVLLGIADESQYLVVFTRVAGIWMDWYPGLLNCNCQTDVVVSGKGTIDGQGEYWWRKYWGDDGKGGMRKEYDAKGLRWACDYDCRRVRNVVVAESSDITLKEFTSAHSGFWNVHLCCSRDVHVDGIKVAACSVESPSTDGIDIDSCNGVLVENCTISCNDDSICVKSGRDADGIRANRPCRDITIQNCELRQGFGITIGSEVSGGISDIAVKNIRYRGTDCGFRIKSSAARRGYIRNVVAEGLEMVNVKYPFHLFLNWHPAYSVCKLPEGYGGSIPEHWRKLLEPIPDDIPKTEVCDILIRDISAYNEPEYTEVSRAFCIEGFEDVPIHDVTFRNLSLSCKEIGMIQHAKDIRFENVSLSVSDTPESGKDAYDNR